MHKESDPAAHFLSFPAVNFKSQPAQNFSSLQSVNHDRVLLPYKKTLDGFFIVDISQLLEKR